MRFITTPRKWKRDRKQCFKKALQLLNLSTFSIDKIRCECEIYQLHKHLVSVPGFPGTVEYDQYLGVAGCAYSYLLSIAFGWKVGELILSETAPEFDLQTVVSPSFEYSVSSGFLMEEEFKLQKKLSVELYEKIKHGELPPSKAGMFLDLASHFYGKPIPKATFFFPLDKDKTEQIEQTIRAAAALIGAVFTEDLQLKNFSPESAIRNLENLILTDRADFAKGRKKTLYLAAISALYGHLLKLACGYNWGSAWFGDFTGTLTLYGPDKKYFMRPANILRGELKSTSPTCRLLTLCHQIQTNTLPPPEIEGIPEEIL